MTTVRLLSFYGGKRCWTRSAQRLERQASNFPEIASISLWNPSRLAASDITEKEAVLDLARTEARGFGLWSWKLPIVRKELLELREGELLLYLDCGCSLNPTPNSLKRFREYIRLAQSGRGLFFSQSLIEREWSKRELREDFPDESLWLTGQLLGGIFFLSRSEHTVRFLDDAIAVATRSGFDALRAPKSKASQELTFQEHRNDQSVISLSAKQAGFTVLRDETYFSPNWNQAGEAYPIWATRLCSGNEDVSNRLASRVRRELERRLPW